MTDEEITRISHKIRDEVLKSELWRNAGTVLAFLSFGKEITLDDLILRSLRAGKKVFIPRVEGEIIVFYGITGLDSGEFVISRMGIREPSPEKEKFIPSGETEILILVPGLGFTENGIRMGRGGGFYDRFLKEIKDLGNITTMGVCSRASILPDLPAEIHDMRVRYLCCEGGIIKTTL